LPGGVSTTLIYAYSTTRCAKAPDEARDHCLALNEPVSEGAKVEIGEGALVRTLPSTVYHIML